MFRLIGELLSPAGDRAKLGILGYHRALSAPDAILHEIDRKTLEAQLRLLATEFNVIGLAEACERLRRGDLPSRAACITFDDGYADNEEIALPLLKQLRLTATFFVCTGYSDGGLMFNDVLIEAVRRAPTGTYDLSQFELGKHKLGNSASRRAAVDALIPQLKYRPMRERKVVVDNLAEIFRAPPFENLMMSAEQIKRLHDAGMEIGAHTTNHPILMRVNDEEARDEILGNKRALEEITGSPVTLFAYPNGKPGQDYGPQHVRLVRDAGFAAAVSTIDGVAHRGSDLYQLPRFSPWERNSVRLGVRLLVSCARSSAS